MRKLSILLVALFTVIALGSAWFTYRLSASAREVAGGNPFCLIVPKNSPFRKGYSYQAASSWRDITPLVMRGRSWLYHAVLVVDQGARITRYNWSYGSMSFRSDMREGADAAGSPLICKTGNSLRGGPLGDEVELAFLIDRVRWGIDNAYQPSPNYRGFSFYAVEPEFRPLSGLQISQSPNAYWVVSVDLGDDRIASRRRSMELRLKSDFYRRPGYQVFEERDEDGNLLAALGCMPPTIKNPRSCQHDFIFDGMAFSFRHAPMPKEDWLRLQRNLFEKVISFKSQ